MLADDYIYKYLRRVVNSTDKPKLLNKLVNRAFVSSLTSGTSVVMASDSLEIDGVGKEEGVNWAIAAFIASSMAASLISPCLTS